MPDLPNDIDSAVQDALRELMQDDYALLIDTFSRDSQKRLAQLHLSLQAQDWEDFRQTAHSFKGSCGNMGATALQQACEEAELAGIAADAEAAQASYSKIQHCFERVVPLLGL
ncbi:MAG: Hpt domain-containing protein [Pseudomonas sp.]|jgi:HPt (histidine-containing phosphotransfer) domain-containing protein|nr:Hpt domain-containing protein [Pseudomonas sp.]